MPREVWEPSGGSPVVRPLGPEDARAYFEVRLEALESCPAAFASSAGEIIRRARVVSGLRQLQLGVGAANLPALRLYESRRFVAFGTGRGATIVDGRTTDEIHMQLFLEEPSRPR